MASRDMVEEEFEPEPSSPVMYSMCNMTFHILTEATLKQGEHPGTQGHMEDDESVPPPQGLDGPLYTFDDADDASIGGLEAGGTTMGVSANDDGTDDGNEAGRSNRDNDNGSDHDHGSHHDDSSDKDQEEAPEATLSSPPKVRKLINFIAGFKAGHRQARAVPRPTDRGGARTVCRRPPRYISGAPGIP